MTIQTFFLSLLVERKDEQDFTHYFNIPLGKKEIVTEKTGRIKKNDRIYFLDIRNLYTYNLGNYKILKRTILSAYTIRIILVFLQSLRICGKPINREIEFPL